MIVPSPPRVTIRSGSDRSAGVVGSVVVVFGLCSGVLLLFVVLVVLLLLLSCIPVPNPGTG